jgi:hypothetical protein
MREEYDFSESKRAPYAEMAGEVHVVTLDGDVWCSFPNSEAVNKALRRLMTTETASGEMSKAS